MSSIQAILSAARSGMSVSQSQAALVSRNLANVNTPGYARETLPLWTELGGLAVRAGPSTASRQIMLERALAATSGRFAFHDTQVSYLGLAEQATNDLDDAGLGATIDRFRAALGTASANPAGRAERNQVLASAQVMAGAFSTTRAELEQAQASSADQADVVSTRVNQLTTEIAQLNGRIRSARAGEEKNTLMGRRASLVSTLSSLMSVDIVPRSDGTLQISSGGHTLVELASAAQLSVSSGGPGAPIEVTISRSGHEPEVVSGSAGSAFGGELGGLIEAHEDVIAPAIANLDQAAYKFMSDFNTQHAAGYDLNGNTGHQFWDLPTSSVGAAAAMKLSADVNGKPEALAFASDPNGVGNNENLLKLDAFAETAHQDFRSVGNDVSQALVRAQGGAELERGSVEQLSNLLASETGVDIDEEMVSLSQAQTALAASSNVIKATQTMIDTVLGMMG
ncbi:MAG: flagellar hook-associated protein FlgK [Myxococcota bacterium]